LTDRNSVLLKLLFIKILPFSAVKLVQILLCISEHMFIPLVA